VLNNKFTPTPPSATTWDSVLQLGCVMNNVTGVRWQEGAPLSVANGSFSRMLSQPIPNGTPKFSTETTFVTVQQSPTALFNPTTATEGQAAGFTPSFSDGNGIVNSMQADIASALTGAVSHGVGYDAKTGHAIGGTPQYVGTRFGNAIQAAGEAEKADSIYSFSYGTVAALNVHKANTDNNQGMQEQGRNAASKSRYFDWRTFYNARLFFRIMQKASDADRRAGLLKARSFALSAYGDEHNANIALKAFLDALNEKVSTGALVSFSRQIGVSPSAPRQAAPPVIQEPAGEGFWDVYAHA
jgi:hypothetical protein